MEKIFKCNNCSESFEKREDYKKHCKISEHEYSSKCKFCGKDFYEMYENTAAHQVHCNMNPKNKEIKEKVRLKAIGRPLSEAHKKKVSEGRLKYLNENPDKVPYLMNHSSKRSNPEIIVENELLKRGIKGWISKFRNGIYEYDFAFPELKVDVEIDGHQHKQEKYKMSDRRRDEWTISQGWRVLRIEASIVKNSLSSVVNEIEKFIGKENLETQKNLNPKDYGILTNEERLIKKEIKRNRRNGKIEAYKKAENFVRDNFKSEAVDKRQLKDLGKDIKYSLLKKASKKLGKTLFKIRKKKS